MATSTYTEAAVQICALTAFSEVLKNFLMRRYCLIHVKNNSTCQRALYKAQIVAAGGTKQLGQEDERLAGLGILEADAPQTDGVALR
jgi:hypothetical protein